MTSSNVLHSKAVLQNCLGECGTSLLSIQWNYSVELFDGTILWNNLMELFYGIYMMEIFWKLYAGKFFENYMFVQIDGKCAFPC